MNIKKIPNYIKQSLSELENAGFEAFIVGGCVRDLLLEKEPKDWDITTNARPEQVLKIFPDGKYENVFGTVLVPFKDIDGKTENTVEITTYRSESGYSDRRHPDEIVFEDDLENDLARRDFTINAMAVKLIGDKYELKDIFGGQKDIDGKVIRAVGEPSDRFKEDALRMMRAVRFAGQLDFEFEPKTKRAVVKLAGSLKFIAKERIRDELIKILESDKYYEGIKELYETKLLQYILPELLAGEGVAQDRHHYFSVFKHSMQSLKYCPGKDWRVRFASLMHDVGKPRTKKIIDGIATFYNHEYAGERILKKICLRLHFSNNDTEKILNLVRNHMFYYNVDEVTAASVRRLIKKVGRENLKDLIDVRIADRLGSGVPKGKPYKLRHLEFMMKKVQNDPVSVKMLAINGNDLMNELKIEPGPKIGAILDVLLSEVIEDPQLNTREYLLKRSKELEAENLNDLRDKAKDVIEDKREADEKNIKRQFKVR
jgi:tRNA nucleotidyltransferase (CCA-adding enzyme)